MKAIGANADEEDFVKERIALRLRTQQLLDDTDKIVKNTEKMLDDFEKDDARWKAWGKIFDHFVKFFGIFFVIRTKTITFARYLRRNEGSIKADS